MNKEFLHMQKLAGIITESEYKAKLEEADVMGKIGKSYPAPSQKPEREIYDFWKQHNLLNNGWEFIDLSIPNIKVGDRVVSANGYFGMLVKIKDGKYFIGFDVDGKDDPLTKVKKEDLEDLYLVDKRK
jgi:hypothetical protein